MNESTPTSTLYSSLRPMRNGFIVLPHITYVSAPVFSDKKQQWLFCFHVAGKENWYATTDEKLCRTEHANLICAIETFYTGK